MSAWCALVEDEPILARTLVRVLRIRGLDTIWVRGRRALERVLEVRAEAPALLVLDVDLGGTESGLMIARAFAEDVRVFFWTGEPESVPREFRRQGVQVFSKGNVAGLVEAALLAVRK